MARTLAAALAASNAAAVVGSSADYKIGALSATIDAARAIGIDTTEAEARLAVLRRAEVEYSLGFAMGAALLASQAVAEGGGVLTALDVNARPTTGDLVMVSFAAGGARAGEGYSHDAPRRGTIVRDDHDSQPYKVQYEDDGSYSEWLYPDRVSRATAADFKLVALSAAIEAAKALEVDTSLAEGTLSELKAAELTANLAAALAASNSAAAAGFSTNDSVEVRGAGSVEFNGTYKPDGIEDGVTRILPHPGPPPPPPLYTQPSPALSHAPCTPHAPHALSHS